MSSTSLVSVLLAYRRTRLPLRLYLPLLLFMVAAGAAASGLPVSTIGVSPLLLCCTLLLQFRLWDDLIDLPRDRREHSERVLVRATSLVPFYALMLTAFSSSVALLTWEGADLRLVVFLALNAAFLVWYRILRNALSGAVVGYHVVLLKYPVFVFVLSSPPCSTATLLSAACSVYLALCVYEVLHDVRLRSRPVARAALALELAALVILAVHLAGSQLPLLSEARP